MEDQNINVFISSKMRDTNSKPCKFTANFPSGLIQCDENQGININIVSFDILNSFYNINENNNKIRFLFNAQTDPAPREEVLEIPTGNYSATQLSNLVNDFSEFVKCEYSKIRNKFTFSYIPGTSILVAFVFCGNGSIFGYDNWAALSWGGLNADFIHTFFPHITFETIYEHFFKSESFESISPANLMYFNKVIIRVNGVDFELASLENITSDRSSTVFYRSNILLWLSRNDYMPFQMISYNNEDAGTSYCYNIYNKNINSLTFEITNEHGDLIDEALDWSMALQFTIYNKKDNAMVKEMQIHTSYLRELFVFMNVFYGMLIGRR